jgi:hypothetical protein
MSIIRKKLVTDEFMRPVAVLIEYADWLRIEEALGIRGNGCPPTDLSQHAGKLDWPVDGLAYQNEVRGEWD